MLEASTTAGLLYSQVRQTLEKTMSDENAPATIALLEQIRTQIRGLSNRGLKSFTRYGEDEMRSRCSEIVSDAIKALQESEGNGVKTPGENYE